jgi:ElaB/YqjD/DUF883 family membrane-anchored ribosome-binding protein
MAQKRAAIASSAVNAEPSKAQLQRQMEEARETIAQTVEEIKDTVTDSVESVKETVSDVLDWNEHFTKNPLLWGAAAVGAGLVIGYSIAAMREGERHPRRNRRPQDSVADSLLAELATVGENILLPAVNERVKSLFGIDLSKHLLDHGESRARSSSSRKSSKKSSAKKGTTKKAAARRTTKKSR